MKTSSVRWRGEVETPDANLPRGLLAQLHGHTPESLPHLASLYKGEECVGTWSQALSDGFARTKSGRTKKDCVS
jgi:hypothetical protein